MEFKKDRIIELRERLRTCYRFLHRDEKEKIGHLKSTKTSETNPFIKALSVDLKERFGDDSTGNSVHTLRSIFFDNEKVNYEGDTIVNLELFCSELEEQKKGSKKIPLNPQKKRFKLRWVIMPVVLGVLVILYFVLSNIGNRLMDTMDEVLNDNLKGYFNPDPSGNGDGFVRLVSIDGSVGSPLLDSLSIPNLKKGDSLAILIKFDFHNYGLIDIKEVKAKIHFAYNIESNTLRVTGELSGKNAETIYDTSKISNVLPDYKVEYYRSAVENRHGEKLSDPCKGYSYSFQIDESIIFDGYSLGTLDIVQNGWCDQGVIDIFIIIKNTDVWGEFPLNKY